jgi:dCTP deaminase
LINVSGFHVDPGFRGRLIFSVYNAGPVPVHLRQGQPMFLLWLASLDSPTKRGRQQPVQLSFPPDLISGISGELQSLAGINKKIKEVDKDLTGRVHAIEREQTYYRFIALFMMLLVSAMLANWVREGGIGRLFAPPATVQDTSSTEGAANPVTAPDANTAITTDNVAAGATSSSLPADTVLENAAVGNGSDR